MKAHRVLVSWILAGGAMAQTQVDLRTQSKSVDFSAASLTRPARTGTSLPGTCLAGEMFYLSNAVPNPSVYYCAATNSWAKLGTVTGGVTSGDCTRFDANGNIVDSGAACGGQGQANFQQAFSSATSVNLAHNLNSSAIVFACFDNSTPPLWILPKSVALTNANTLTVTFASSQSGSCIVNASGGGGGLPAFLSGSAQLTFGSIAQAACAQLSFSLTGANPGDVVAPGWPATLETGLMGSMIASASNTVVVRLCNLSGASVTPAVQTFKATVIH
jgi:hypothetical protein